MKNTVKIISVILVLLMFCMVFTACAHKKASKHKAVGEWLSDETSHWHACKKNKCEDAGDRAPHAYDNACDATCNVCGYTRAITHTYATEWSKDATNHWHSCSVCGAKGDVAAHAFTVDSATTATLKAEATSTAKAQYWKSCACGAVSTTEYFESGKITGVITDIQDLSKTFDGERVTAPTYNTNSTGEVTIAWYTPQGTEMDKAPLNPNTWKVVITIAETETHTGVTAEKEFVIGKAQAALTNLATSPVMIKYGDSYEITYTTNSQGTVSIEYKLRGAPDTDYTADKPTNVGAYTARVTIAEEVRYFGTSATVDFEIEQFVLTGLHAACVYNGSEVHEVDLESEGYYGVTVEVTFNKADVEDSYAIGIRVLENGEETGNYALDTSTCSAEIVAKEVSIVWDDTPLRFNGIEKQPSYTLGGIKSGDECYLDLLVDGDNIWYGSTFTYNVTLAGADAGNYKLPDGYVAPNFTIVIDDTVAVGEGADVGSAALYCADAPYVMYYSIEIESEGWYYFDYANSTQGASFVFKIFEKGNVSTSVSSFSTEDANKQSNAFYLEVGEYYVMVETSEETQGDILTILGDEHTGKDAYGFCNKGCGTYLGEELPVNCPTGLRLAGNNRTVYYKFFGEADMVYRIGYYEGGDGTNLTIKCYRVGDNGQMEEVTISEGNRKLGEVDEYYYLVISLTGNVVLKEVTFEVTENFDLT